MDVAPLPPLGPGVGVEGLAAPALDAPAAAAAVPDDRALGGFEARPGGGPGGIPLG